MAGRLWISCRPMTLTLAGIVPSCCSPRVGVTVTSSRIAAGCSVTSTFSAVAGTIACRQSANPGARTMSVTSPAAGGAIENRPDPSLVVRRSAPEPTRAVTVAPTMAAPVGVVHDAGDRGRAVGGLRMDRPGKDEGDEERHREGGPCGELEHPRGAERRQLPTPNSQGAQVATAGENWRRSGWLCRLPALFFEALALEVGSWALGVDVNSPFSAGSCVAPAARCIPEDVSAAAGGRHDVERRRPCSDRRAGSSSRRRSGC